MFTSQKINLIFVVFTIVFFVKNNSIDAQTPKLQNPGSSAQKTIVGKLAGENITKEALVNLVQDRDAPITAGLV